MGDMAGGTDGRGMLAAAKAPFEGLIETTGGVSMSWRSLWCGWVDVTFLGDVDEGAPVGDDEATRALRDAMRIRDGSICLSAAYGSNLLLTLARLAGQADGGDASGDVDLLFEMEQDGDYEVTVTEDAVMVCDAHGDGRLVTAHIVAPADGRQGSYATSLAEVMRRLCAAALGRIDAGDAAAREAILLGVAAFMEGDGGLSGEEGADEAMGFVESLMRRVAASAGAE